MRKWHEILWGSKEEDDAIRKVAEKSPDPDELTIENAYKTRWIWYHTILVLELLITNVLLLYIAIKI
mgnify:CR=1 FL=1